MGLFGKDRGERIAEFPCYLLETGTHLVPLPGILYNLVIERTYGERILGQFRGIGEAVDGALTGAGEAAEVPGRVAEVMKAFQERYDSGDKTQAVYICLVTEAAAGRHIGCIARLTGARAEGGELSVLLRGLVRAVVGQPVPSRRNEMWNGSVTVLDDAQRVATWGARQLDFARQGVFGAFEELDAGIGTFTARFKSSQKRGADGAAHLLTLSPLANTLFFHFSRSSFERSWKILRTMMHGFRDAKKDIRTAMDMLSVADLTVGLLPTTTAQRLEFLQAEDPAARIKTFVRHMQQLLEVFGSLYRATEYVHDRFETHGPIAKSQLIANQLRSLRFYIDDIKRNKPESGPGGRSRRLLPRPASGNSAAAGEEDDSEDSELVAIKRYVDEIEVKGVHADGVKMLKKDYRSLSKMHVQSTEYQMLRNYFDFIMGIPFGIYVSTPEIDLVASSRKLDNDHYGLVQVKKRLLEYLCVLKLSANSPGVTADAGAIEDGSATKRAVVYENKAQEQRKTKVPFLLLVGPPGVGKTSVAKSVADVLGRRFQRISLGGIHNEAEIRGHRRTYVGAMAGMIVNALCKAGCMNPLILLDEIDKVLSVPAGAGASRLNGDPGAALLEVLDPEQNHTFTDHYVGFPVDLSQVLFFCTANDLSGMSEPLVDRMEVIHIEGYTYEEKIAIGRHFLLPKQIRLNSFDMTGINLSLTDDAWRTVVVDYTREAGVRNLDRQLGAIVRGKIVEYVENNMSGSGDDVVTQKNLPKFLGLPPHSLREEVTQTTSFAEKYGVVHGLSYNSDGTGGVLVFEVIRSGDSRDKRLTVQTTGNLGTVLSESVSIATSLVKSLLARHVVHSSADDTSVAEFFRSECHLHVPFGAVPKDGPSAGAAISLALLSLALKRPVDPALCVTGEITLRGKILPVGGVKEKLLAAQLQGMGLALVPRGNRNDLVELAEDNAETQQRLLADPALPELATLQHKLGMAVHYCSDFRDLVLHAWPTADNLWHACEDSSVRPQL
ncbi:AFL121Wp [Eremothecium gossypii ATCC 10895]|uniref:Lon protease homolog 2, peroxisomal n=1 Tax=Eremothecium gossypii (strain ATCC 10895 / CBS 109.51 / FGSC 9923 / NRRL Y-1056) TaxID=284811 RepID=LONP2_EREGS|nr:AFL121Wp [Eremothecium gossypii ATCC 10895]Q755E4.2 RecName: Full=Lon protease homolog 2, peroxisomal [Eremothecium gossypii ATCC 10895]AAS53253.2 AFL121Wp [Eremothecium gossypii ATCC 10895]AEY97563.1 FAFL121Wp [Eremothecium gossypii FDAG1]